LSMRFFRSDMPQNVRRVHDYNFYHLRMCVSFAHRCVQCKTIMAEVSAATGCSCRHPAAPKKLVMRC
jgi:hypothetical protein